PAVQYGGSPAFLPELPCHALPGTFAPRGVQSRFAHVVPLIIGPRALPRPFPSVIRIHSGMTSKSWLTDSFEWTWSIALDSRSATERILRLDHLFSSGMCTVLVRSISSSGALLSRSTAGPERSACVAAA